MNTVHNPYSRDMNVGETRWVDSGSRADTGRSGTPDGLRMSTDLPDEVVNSPVSVSEAYAGSMRALLRKNLGYYVVASFLIGTSEPVSWQGILYDVGNDYLVIYQSDEDRYIIGDLYSLKFIEFHDSATPTPTTGARKRDGARIW